MSQYSRSKSDDLYVNLRLAQDFFLPQSTRESDSRHQIIFR